MCYEDWGRAHRRWSLHCYLGAYDRRLAATHCRPPLVASCYTLVRPTDTLSCCKSSVKKACLLIHSRGPQKNTPPEPWGLSPDYWKCTGSKQWLAEWATLSRSSLRTLRLATIARHLHPLTQKGKLRKFSFPCWLYTKASSTAQLSSFALRTWRGFSRHTPTSSRATNTFWLGVFS